MSGVFVFGQKEADNNYSTLGIAGGPLKYTECTFKEQANGDSILTLTHPLDDFGRYRTLERDNILLASVPVRTTPEIQNGSFVATVWTYEVRSDDVLTSVNQRTLYKNQTGSGKMHVMSPGESVTVVQQPAGDSGETRWKVKTDYGTGWMRRDGLSVNAVATHIIDEDNSNAIEAVQTPWQIMPQLFRIYDVQKSMDSVQVTARHISYDLLYNITKYKSEETVALQTALNGVLEQCDDPDHGFAAYTNVANEQPGLDYLDKNPIDAILDPENGICKKFEVGLVRDNYDLYFLHDPGMNRGVVLRYGKNLLGIEFEDSDDEVVTRIVPVGENKDGTPLYLEDGVGTFTKTLQNGSKGDDVKTMQSMLVKAGYSVGGTGVDGIFGSKTQAGLERFQADAQLPVTGVFTSTEYNALVEKLHLSGNGRYIDSPNVNAYPVPHEYVLRCDNCTVNDKEEGAGKIDVDTARARMREQALKMFEEGCDEPRIKMKVEFQNLGDTEEYAAYRNLENCFLFDYAIVQHEKLGIDVTARIVGIEWDVSAERMKSVEIGQIGKTLANTGITTWQVPSGFSGSKIGLGTIGAGQLGNEIISANHIQSNSINTRHLMAENITAFVIEAITAKFQQLSAEEITTQELWAELVNTDELYAALAEIGKANIKYADINFAEIDQLVSQIATIVYLSAQHGGFNFLKVQTLLGSVMNIEQGVGEEIYIRNLAATSASFVGATIGNLVLKSEDGKYYQIVITADGEIHTNEVAVSMDEILAGMMANGTPIVETQINVGRLNGENIYGSMAVITHIVTTLLEAGTIRASDAFIASAAIPQLYTTAIQALSDDLIISADSSIRLLVGDMIRQNQSGTRNYIPKSRYLKDAIGTRYKYPSVVDDAYVDISTVEADDEWVQTTLTQSSFQAVDTEGAYVATIPGTDILAYREAHQMGSPNWRIVRHDLGELTLVRLDSMTLEETITGVLPLAYEAGGLVYRLDASRVGSQFLADAILTNELIATEKTAVTSVTISALQTEGS